MSWCFECSPSALSFDQMWNTVVVVTPHIPIPSHLIPSHSQPQTIPLQFHFIFVKLINHVSLSFLLFHLLSIIFAGFFLTYLILVFVFIPCTYYDELFMEMIDYVFPQEFLKSLMVMVKRNIHSFKYQL